MPLDDLENSAHLHGLTWMVALSQGLGIVMIVMMGLWLNKDLGGFAWDGSSKQFNLHPLSMVCGLIFLYGESSIAYRIFRNTPKMKVKIIHAVLHSMALVAAIVGLVAVFGFHKHNNISNMYSLHSWCGMATVLLFCFQLVLGFGAYLIPGARENLKSYYVPIHRFFGAAILMFAAITCLTGINEKLFFVLKSSYQKLDATAILGNMCGVAIVAYVTAILYILNRKEWARKPERTAEMETLGLLSDQE